MPQLAEKAAAPGDVFASNELFAHRTESTPAGGSTECGNESGEHDEDMTLPNRMPHTLAVLRGVAEGDEGKYLGSTMALEQHGAPLLVAGLVTRGEHGELVATPAGRDFYAAHRLGDLPASRANAWVSGDEVALLDAAYDSLDALLNR